MISISFAQIPQPQAKKTPLIVTPLKRIITLYKSTVFLNHKRTYIDCTRLLITLVAIVLLSACKKVVVYEILIRNNTDYRLDRIHVSTREEDLYPSVEPYGETTIFLDSRKRPGIFVRPSWDFGIRNYSDSIGSYEYTYGDYIALDQLDKDKVNHVIVFLEPNPEYADDVFEISINE